MEGNKFWCCSGMMELVIKNRTFSNECFGWAHRKISRIVYSKTKRASCRNRTRSLCNITDDGIHSLQRDDQKVGTKKENSFDICKAILLAGLSFDGMSCSKEANAAF